MSNDFTLQIFQASIDLITFSIYYISLYREEDNDDIVEILDKKCPRLKELYGEYYISEIIGRHPEFNRKVIVADVSFPFI